MRAAAVAMLAALVLASGCAWMPAELNLSPLYRHRLDAEGNMLELDVLWPVFHWERLADGGSDFRVRPLYRVVTAGDPARPAVEHQFLWPLGRVAVDDQERLSRLFPLWYHRERENEHGQRETDWYALFPFFWGGSSEDGSEDYFAIFPLFADIPDFLFYDRFQSVLFPLWVHTLRDGRESHLFLWPLIGWGGGEEEGEPYWHRALPFYAVAVDPGDHERYAALWPIVSWGRERLGSDDPVSTFMVWPLYGQQTSDEVDAWTVAWPFFRKYSAGDDVFRLDCPWPLFRWYEVESEEHPLRQWWVFPFVSHTQTEDQNSWVFLWPLVWIREFDDPEGKQTQQWVLPFFWHVHRERSDGREDDFLKLWPLFHREVNADGTASWRLFSPLPWRGGNVRGYEEAYGWLWTLATSQTRAPDDTSMHLAAHLYTTRERQGRRQTSVPFLFNYESDAGGSTLRLFQFLPIPLGGGNGESESSQSAARSTGQSAAPVQEQQR